MTNPSPLRILLVPLLIAASSAFPALACKHGETPSPPAPGAGGHPAHGATTSETAASDSAAAGGGRGPWGYGGWGFGGYGGYGAGGAAGAPGTGGAGGFSSTASAIAAGSSMASTSQGSGGGATVASSTSGTPAGSGGAGVSSTSGASQGSGGAAASSTSGAGTSSSGSVSCAIGHVVISEILSRGAGGANDEFVALFNATGTPVTLDAGWTLKVRGAADTEYRTRWTGFGLTVPAWGHYLIGGSWYILTPAADDSLSAGIPDAASVVLVHQGTTVDAVCYAYDAATQSAFDASFTCAGTPVSNLPHDDKATTTSNVDASIVRRPGGAAGNCTDTGDNAADLVGGSSPTPANLASPPTP